MIKATETTTSSPISSTESCTSRGDAFDRIEEITRIVLEIVESIGRSLSPLFNGSEMNSLFNSSTTETPPYSPKLPVEEETIHPPTTEEKRERIAIQTDQIRQSIKAQTERLQEPVKLLQQSLSSPSAEAKQIVDVCDQLLELEQKLKALDDFPETAEPLDLTGIDLRSEEQIARDILNQESTDRVVGQLMTFTPSSNVIELRKSVLELQTKLDGSSLEVIQLANQAIKLAKTLLKEGISDRRQTAAFHDQLSIIRQMIKIRQEIGGLQILTRNLVSLTQQEEGKIQKTAAKAAKASVDLSARQAEKGLLRALQHLKTLVEVIPS